MKLPMDTTGMKVVDKPWGREIWWAVTPKYVGKVIEVKGGCSLSLQYHETKMETLFFLTGAGSLVLDDAGVPIKPGLCRTIMPGQVHRIVATADVVLLEVSSPEVEDIVRIADLYGRVAEKKQENVVYDE
jgi:mannose-1-phosphate guanylyltransferase